MARRYTKQEKAEALTVLDANAGNVTRTSQMLKIPRSTVAYHRDNTSDEIQLMKEAKKSELANSLLDLAAMIVRVIPEKLEAAPAEKLAVTLGVTIDKYLLLTGQATTRNEHHVRALPPLPDDRLDDILK